MYDSDFLLREIQIKQGSENEAVLNFYCFDTFSLWPT